jgi:hypothetical protein
MTNTTAFTHKPKRLNGVYFHPTNTKALFDLVWAEARKQDLYPADEKHLGCVGNKDGYFYFQIRGLTTGFARITSDEIKAEAARVAAKFGG